MNVSKKLHIGSGKNYIPGFVNVDLFSSVHADIYADLSALPFDRESFDLIYSSHVLEHCHRKTILATLSHWRDLLKFGGTLRLAVPNFEAVVEWYQKTKNLESVLGLLYARQDHPKNNHFITFDKRYLTDQLVRVGFRRVREWDWKLTEHAQFDDFSQAYLPHLNKTEGLLVSLNLEATK